MDALKKTKRRATERLLQRLGHSEQATNEKEFQVLLGDFNETQKEVVVLLSKFQLYADALDRWQKCGEALAKELNQFVENGSDDACESRATLLELQQRFCSTQSEIGTACSNMVDTWSLQVLSPLRDVAFTFANGVQKRVQERSADKIDYEAYRRRVKTLTPSDSKASKVSQAQRNFAKLAATQDRFEDNDKFLTEQFLRAKQKRSEFVVDEVALAVHFQSEFLRSVQTAYENNFQDTLSELLPNESGIGYDKRRNRWLLNGDSRVREMGGYLDSRVCPLPPNSEPANGEQIGRTQSARHYVRNAPRNKQATLKSIGKQLSLTNLDRRALTSRAPTEPAYVLPPVQAADASTQDDPQESARGKGSAESEEDNDSASVASEERNDSVEPALDAADAQSEAEIGSAVEADEAASEPLESNDADEERVAAESSTAPAGPKDGGEPACDSTDPADSTGPTPVSSPPGPTPVSSPPPTTSAEESSSPAALKSVNSDRTIESDDLDEADLDCCDTASETKNAADVAAGLDPSSSTNTSALAANAGKTIVHIMHIDSMLDAGAQSSGSLSPLCATTNSAA